MTEPGPTGGPRPTPPGRPTPAAKGDGTPERRSGRRRRRTQAGSPANAPPAPPTPPAQADTAPAAERSAARRASDGPRRGRGESAAERALRALVSSRPTQLSSTAAMRAREVATPSAEDLAAAAADLVIVRRNYVPPEPLRTGRRPAKGGGRRDRRARPDPPGQEGSSGAAGSAS